MEYTEDYSAKNFNRPEFKKMMNFVKTNRNKIDYIYFHKWDRFSRNVTESYEYIDKFRNLGIEINAISEMIDWNSPQSKILLAIYLAVPDVENHIRSDRTIMGNRAKLKQGKLMGKAPIGYLNSRDENDHKIVEIDKDKGYLVRLLFEDFATGLYKQAELIEKYNKKGLKLKSKQISKMLRNRVYAGEILVPASKTESEKIVESEFEALVGKATYVNVQRVLKGRRPFRIKTGKYENELPLKPFLVCGECGYKLTGTFKVKPSGKGYGYYHSERDYCKCGTNISTSFLHPKIEGLLSDLKPNNRIVALIPLMLEESTNSQNKSNTKEIRRLNNLINELEEKKSKLLDKYINDKVLEDDYNQFNSKLNSELDIYRGDIALLKVKFDNIGEYLNTAVYMFKNLGKLYSSGDYKFKRKLMSSILEKNIEISENTSRTPKFKEVVHLICSGSKGLQADKNKKGDLSNEKSPRVTPRRIELLLPG